MVFIRIAIGDYNAGPGRGKYGGDRCADPKCASGNICQLPFKTEQILQDLRIRDLILVSLVYRGIFRDMLPGIDLIDHCVQFVSNSGDGLRTEHKTERRIRRFHNADDCLGRLDWIANLFSVYLLQSCLDDPPPSARNR